MGSLPAPAKEATVAIIGGGVGGLALAIGLHGRNVPVQLYEAAAAFEEIGLGLSIGPAAHRAMPLIDPQIRHVYDRLVTTHADSPGYEHLRQTWFEIVWASGDKAGQMLMDLKAPPSGQTTVRRADFLAAMVDLVPPEIRHFGKRLEKLEEFATQVKLSFKDGTSAVADVVIGCDGIKSKVKECMNPEEHKRTKPHYSGMYCYRAALDMETMAKAVGDDRARVSTMYIGQGAYAISYPIMRAQKVNVGLYTLNDQWDSQAWVRPATQADMRKDFEHMGPHIGAIMQVNSPPLSCLHFSYFAAFIAWRFLWLKNGVHGSVARARSIPMGGLRTSAFEHLHEIASRHYRRCCTCIHASSGSRRGSGHRRRPRPHRAPRRSPSDRSEALHRGVAGLRSCATPAESAGRGQQQRKWQSPVFAVRRDHG